jgi:hypothetical protein
MPATTTKRLAAKTDFYDLCPACGHESVTSDRVIAIIDATVVASTFPPEKLKEQPR